MQALTNLSPLDGRYYDKVNNLRLFASEYGLIRYRLQVEIDWLILLSTTKDIEECPAISDSAIAKLQGLIENFSVEDAQKIKDIESKTNHDVKAVEYFLKDALLQEAELKPLLEFVHFACTSEDINNLAYSLMLKDCLKEYLQTLEKQILTINTLAKTTKSMAMLSLTHGQPASPTTLGKELANVTARLSRQFQQLKNQDILGKINGAVGNFNAHIIAYPQLDWAKLSKTFVEGFGLTWNAMTTQIEPHDAIAELFDNIARINTILIDFSRDVWGYISRGIFNQKMKEGEVGSSTMPHKINPIDFENAEGNLGVANALLSHMARKLPCSRYQRDLTDSTVLRNIGSAFGYSCLALSSMQKGLHKLEPNQSAMQNDLDNAWEVLAEPIQTVMRRYGIENPYEKLKELTRGQKITKESLTSFVNDIELPAEAKQQLLELRPHTYVGLADKI